MHGLPSLSSDADDRLPACGVDEPGDGHPGGVRGDITTFESSAEWLTDYSRR
jgi:hypothetical protein